MAFPKEIILGLPSTAVSHIPQLGDATTSLAADVDVSAGDVHLQISGYATLLSIDGRQNPSPLKNGDVMFGCHERFSENCDHI